MNCGEGVQEQDKYCINGTIEKCYALKTTRNITCNEAGTRLDDCKKQLGNWENTSSCQTYFQDEKCGNGSQYQKRTCKDGQKFVENQWKTDNCTKADKEQNSTCFLHCAGIAFSKRNLQNFRRSI